MPPKQKKTNRRQFECLVTLMEENEEIARGIKGASSKAEYKSIWSKFSAKLNSLGPPTRTEVEWQKVWSDLRRKVRDKIAHNKSELRATGGGVNNLHEFTNLEESVVNILSLNKIAESGTSFGITRPSSSRKTCINPDIIQKDNTDSYSLAEINNNSHLGTQIPETTATLLSDKENESEISKMNLPSQSTPLRSSKKTPLKKKKKDYRQKLLTTQTDDLKRISRNVSEIARWMRKIYYIKEEKLKLAKEKFKEKQKRNSEEAQYKMEVLQYKKQKLALEEEKLRSTY